MLSFENSFSSRQGGVLKSAIVLLFFVSAVGTLGWMLLLPSALEMEVESRTGFAMKAETLSCNPLGVSIVGETITLGNPAAFGGGDVPMLTVEAIGVSVSLPALARGEIWMDSLEIEVSKAYIVRDELGNVNLDVFLERLFTAGDQSEPMPFYAAHVRLIIDEVTFVDYSQPMARSQTLRLALDVKLQELEDAKAVFGPIFEIGDRVGAW